MHERIRPIILLLTLGAALSLTAAGVARAQSGEEAGNQAGEQAGSHAAAAAELLALIGIDAGIGPMAQRMRDTTLAQLAAMDVAPGNEEIARPYLEEVGTIIEDALSWEQLEGDFLDAYTATFSEAELEELTRFFRSPTGSKYLANVSALNRLAGDIVRQNAMSAAPRIREVTDAMREALPEQP